MYFIIILFIVLTVYLITKKLHYKKPLSFSLLMGVVSIFILWGID